MEFEQLLLEYRKLMWHIINEFVKTNRIPFDHADDIFQEASMRLYEKFKTYDPACSGPRTFVANTTNIACLRYRREYFRLAGVELEEEIPAGVSSYDKMDEIIETYPTTALNRKIIYHKLYGYTQQEIAKEFNISQSTVSRILSAFRDYLTETLRQ